MEEPGTEPGQGAGGGGGNQSKGEELFDPHGSRNHEVFTAHGAARALSTENKGTAELRDLVVGNTTAPDAEFYLSVRSQLLLSSARSVTLLLPPVLRSAEVPEHHLPPFLSKNASPAGDLFFPLSSLHKYKPSARELCFASHLPVPTHPVISHLRLHNKSSFIHLHQP